MWPARRWTIARRTSNWAVYDLPAEYMGLVAQLVDANALTPALREEMFALMDEHYDNVQRETFVADLSEKQWVIVVRHPESGRELLYVSPQITRYVVGIPRDESDALLRELHQHSTRPEFVYHHEWEIGDLVVFDTLGTMHKRDAWDAREPRYMRQLSTVCRLESS